MQVLTVGLCHLLSPLSFFLLIIRYQEVLLEPLGRFCKTQILTVNPLICL